MGRGFWIYILQYLFEEDGSLLTERELTGEKLSRLERYFYERRQQPKQHNALLIATLATLATPSTLAIARHQPTSELALYLKIYHLDNKSCNQQEISK